MTSTTPTHSRPHTPLRPPSRSSFRTSTTDKYPSSIQPLDTLEPSFAELADSLSVLEQNLSHLQLMHESLSRFSENFAAFLYGLEINAFVVDWPEAPAPESFRRWRRKQDMGVENDATILARATAGNTTVLSTAPAAGAARSELDSTMISDTTFASTHLAATPRRRTLGQDIGAGGNVRGAKRSGIPGRSGSTAGTRGRATARARGGSGIARGRGVRGKA